MTLQVAVRIALGEFLLDVRFESGLSGVTAIYGPSGCGKTTLLRAIAGLQVVPEGTISVGSECWLSRDVNMPVHQRRVGYVFQQPSLFDHLDVAGNLQYGKKRCGSTEGKIQFDEVVSVLDLENLLGRRVQALSGGEQQRVAIGRALLANPRLLLMDEPLASLDAVRKAEILPYLDRLSKDFATPILYVSHSLDEVIRLADQLILMESGRVKASGNLLRILEENQLDPLFGQPFSLVEGRVTRLCTEHQLTEITAAGLKILMPSMDVEDRQLVRLRLYAKDISLTREEPKASSILNIFPARVVSIDDAQHPAQKIVGLRSGDSFLLSQVSRLSCEKLQLKVGEQVFAQIKAASLVH